MNKAQLIDAVANDTGLSKAAAQRAVDAVFSNTSEALQKGEDVVIIGFGTFSVKDRAARVGRNPQTGEEIQIPATKVASFKQGKALKEAVNNVKEEVA